VKREIRSSDNVEAVKSSTDNPEQACPALSLTLQEAGTYQEGLAG